jgi:hypothetical protein
LGVGVENMRLQLDYNDMLIDPQVTFGHSSWFELEPGSVLTASEFFLWLDRMIHVI